MVVTCSRHFDGYLFYTILWLFILYNTAVTFLHSIILVICSTQYCVYLFTQYCGYLFYTMLWLLILHNIAVNCSTQYCDII